MPATTEEERWQVVYDFCSGNFETYKRLASDRGLIPGALLTACMVDAEHPLVVRDGVFLFKSLFGASARLILAEVRAEVIHVPVKTVHTHAETVHTPCVQTPVIHRQGVYTG
jgi:hypothetical protein